MTAMQKKSKSVSKHCLCFKSRDQSSHGTNARKSMYMYLHLYAICLFS